MARILIENCRRALHFLFSEAVVFVSGVQLAEKHPEAAIYLASRCLKLVCEAMECLSRRLSDEFIEKAYEDLSIARDLFASVVEGEPVSLSVIRLVPRGFGDRRVLLLDIAHSYTHRAINSLKKSKNFESYREALSLLSKARRESAPTTLYEFAYMIAKDDFRI